MPGLGVPSLPEKGTPKIVPRLSLNRGTMSTENTERKFFEGITTTTPCSLLHSCGWAELSGTCLDMLRDRLHAASCNLASDCIGEEVHQAT